ncbi:MAG: thiamine phosphate synthase, partial [Polyangiaceae bacterium]
MIVLITDPSKSDDELVTIAEQACEAVPRGKLGILLRDKQRDVYGVLDVGTRISKIAHEHGQLFFLLSDHLRLAYEISTAGMHVASAYEEALRVKEWTGGRSLV